MIINILDICMQPGGLEVAWDYCLEQNMIMPTGLHVTFEFYEYSQNRVIGRSMRDTYNWRHNYSRSGVQYASIWSLSGNGMAGCHAYMG